MYAQDVMTTAMVSIRPDATVREAARLMLRHRVSALPVLDANDRLVGIISEGDLVSHSPLHTSGDGRSWWLRLLAMASPGAADDYVNSHAIEVRDAMSRPVISVAPRTSLRNVAMLIEKHRIKRVPVVSGARVVGIISRADLVRSLATQAEPGARLIKGDRALRRAVTRELHRTGADVTYVNATVSASEVHLWGAVSSSVEKRALLLAARLVPGVRAVRDHTFVIPSRLAASFGAQ